MSLIEVQLLCVVYGLNYLDSTLSDKFLDMNWTLT